MIETAQGWRLEADVAGEWLAVRIGREGDHAPSEPALAESIWLLAERRERRRLAVEFDHTLALTSLLVGQLILLHKRAHLNGGTVRVCGLSPENDRILRLMGLSERFPNYATREAALAGELPNKPR